MRALVLLVIVGSALAWLLSRVVTDRYAWSQPIWWVPTPVLLAPLWCAGVLHSLAWIGRRKRRRNNSASIPPRGGSWRRAGVSGAAILSVAYVVFGEWHLHRAVLGPDGASRVAAVRVVFWNQAGHEAGEIAQGFLEQDPTVLVLANRHSSTSTGELARAFAETGRVYPAVSWPFDVFSRLPVRRWAGTSLGLDASSRAGDGSLRSDTGWAAWYELETEFGTLIVWAVDLPSDPRAHRMPLARQAGRAIAAWQGTVRVAKDDGYGYARATDVGFPAPDIIVGDFNIPRGSASLDVFLEEAGAGGLRNAFADAGYGPMGTWPRQLSVWAIDNCFVGNDVRAGSFTTRDPGVGTHRALVLDCIQENQ